METRKVETADAWSDGPLREIEIKPGGRAEPVFVPFNDGTFALKRTVPGHAKADIGGRTTMKR